MSDASAFWDTRSESDHQEMAAMLAPLIVASRDRNFIDPKAAKAQTYAWRLALAKVPKDIVGEAIARLVTRGINWMPRPGEVKKECAAVVDARRAVIRQRALAACTHASQWVDTDRGLQRCGCWQLMQSELAAVEQRIELPPAQDEHQAGMEM